MRKKVRKKEGRIRKKKKKEFGCIPLSLLFFLVVAIIFITSSKHHKSNPLDHLTEVPYYSLIVEISEENGLPPPLTAAVIRQESGFRPKAQSPVGARGLMQIMPDTGKYIASKRGLRYSEESLDDPSTSIDYGTWLLRSFLERFDGEVETALAAYNAGPNITAKWLEDPHYSRDGKTLYSIPYKETSHYVKKVMGYYELYKEQYPPNKDKENK